MNSPSEPVKVLFVCMGNICRSPAAEAVMKKLIRNRGLHNSIYVDSAGTHRYHVGNPSDSRMREAGTQRGYEFDHLARQVGPQDWKDFDYIVAMDRENLENLERRCPNSPASRAAVTLLLDHCQEAGMCEVPDPYYGGATGFEHVIDLVEKGCEALLISIIERHRLH